MNPDKNKFEALFTEEMLESLREERRTDSLQELRDQIAELNNDPVLLRPDGTKVPKHWSVFQVGENVVIKNYTFKVAYIGETAILFEPVGPVVVGEKNEAP